MGGHVVSLHRRTSLSRSFYCVLLVHSAVPPNPGQARLRLLHASVRAADRLRATCALRATRSHGTENRQLSSKTTQLATRSLEHATRSTQVATSRSSLSPDGRAKARKNGGGCPCRSAPLRPCVCRTYGVCFARGIVCCIVASLHRCVLHAAATQPGTAAVKFLDGGADEGVALWDPSATLWPSNDRTDEQRSAQTNKQAHKHNTPTNTWPRELDALNAHEDACVRTPSGTVRMG